MLRPRYRARLTGSPVAERKCRLRSSDRRARTSASATSPESTPELAAGSTGAGGGADVVGVAGADEDDVEAVEREGLLVADQTLGHATIVAQTAVRVGWARLGESAGAQVPRAGSFDRLRAGSGASGLVRKIRLGPTAFGTGLTFICPTSSECFHMTPSCLLSGSVERRSDRPQSSGSDKPRLIDVRLPSARLDSRSLPGKPSGRGNRHI